MADAHGLQFSAIDRHQNGLPGDCQGFSRLGYGEKVLDWLVTRH